MWPRIWIYLKTTPLFWAVAAFALFWWYAQFIATVAWNAIELIIAQHLLLNHVYATSVDYQNALTWRPLVPTLIVTACRAVSSDPMKIYQFICGVALAGMVGALFLAARKLWGLVAAHTAALLTIMCPALSVYTINHVHSYSHLGMMIVLAPTLCLGLVTIAPGANRRPRFALYPVLGVLWALCYLCRAELLLFFALQVAALALLHWHRKFPLASLLAVVVPFAAIFIPYNMYADHVATRDGIVIRKTIYGFYISQGWADPPPDLTPDIESDGYRYAIQLYGDPVKNGESLSRAIAKNVPAFLRRVKLNTEHFYARYWDENFFPPAYAILVIFALAAFLVAVPTMSFEEQLPLWFLLSLFAASHFILIYHIDARYLTINVPPLLLLAAFGVHRAACAPRAGVRAIAVAACLVLIANAASKQMGAIRAHRPRNDVSIPVMRALGHDFRTAAAHLPLRTGNREPHIQFQFPDSSPLYAEDQFLLAYFTKTAWVNGGAEGSFPRGKFYSFRDSPIDYVYVPASKAADPANVRGWTKISECDVPVVGKYFLFRTR